MVQSAMVLNSCFYITHFIFHSISTWIIILWLTVGDENADDHGSDDNGDSDEREVGFWDPAVARHILLCLLQQVTRCTHISILHMQQGTK